MDILNQWSDDQIALAACGLAVLIGFGLIALFREDVSSNESRSGDPSGVNTGTTDDRVPGPDASRPVTPTDQRAA